jgi:hypothetical protein
LAKKLGWFDYHFRQYAFKKSKEFEAEKSKSKDKFKQGKKMGKPIG